MNTKHTETLTIKERGYAGDMVDLTVHNGAIIGTMYRDYAGDFVRAVNSHEALVEALEAVRIMWDKYGFGDDHEESDRVYAQLLTALESAK